MNIMKHAATMQKPIAFVLGGLLLTPAESLLAATQSPSANKVEKEDTLASDTDNAALAEEVKNRVTARPLCFAF
jgi:hypothetical protein